MCMKTIAMRVRICDREHPHYPATGIPTGKVIILLGEPMAEIRLDSDSHGMDACFVSKGQIEKI